MFIHTLDGMEFQFDNGYKVLVEPDFSAGKASHYARVTITDGSDLPVEINGQDDGVLGWCSTCQVSKILMICASRQRYDRTPILV